MDLIVTVTQEELDAVNSIVLDAQEWLQTAWRMKAIACIERVIKRDTVLQPEKMTIAEQIAKIREIKPAKRVDDVNI